MQLSPIPGVEGLQGLSVGLLPGGVGVIQLARPEKLNAFTQQMWDGLPQAVSALETTPEVRVILVCGQGKHFCAGIDLAFLHGQLLGAVKRGTDPAERRNEGRRQIIKLQDSITSLERCRWPVIAAVHGKCIGGAVDLITACDVRVCSQDASFSVKEVDLGITADLGTLQRLPRIIGHGPASDLALTCRPIDSLEALRMGLVTQVLGASVEQLMTAAVALATQVAAKPHQALMGTKRVLLHNRDVAVSVDAGLEYVATFNSGLLEDLAQQVGAAAKTAKAQGEGEQGRPRAKL